jgi:hypothetical protein
MKKERDCREKRKILYGRLRDSQNPIVKEEEFVKRLRDSLKLRESLNPTVKGIPTERPETTTCCGLNPTVKGIPTERPETTTSCGLNPTAKGIPTEKARENKELQPEFLYGDCSQTNVYVACLRISWRRFMKIFRDEYVPLKGQGARVKICKKSWLKQLRVAVSTKASMPSGSSPQNSRTNFVDLHHSICNFKTRKNFSKAYIIKTTE